MKKITFLLVLALSAGILSLSGSSYSSQTPNAGDSEEGIAAEGPGPQGIVMKDRRGGGGGGRGGRGGGR